MAGAGRSLGNDCHARNIRALRVADRERDDVDFQAAEERGNPGEHAGLVFDQSDKCVQHNGPFSKFAGWCESARAAG